METRRPGPVTPRQQIDDPPQQWADLSHELNQPLTALMLYLRAVERALPRTRPPTRRVAFCKKQFTKPTAPK